MWCLLLTVQLYTLGLLIGWALGLTGWSQAVAVTGLVKLLTTAAMTVVVMTPLALAASVGRGYLPGVGAMIVAVFVAQVVAALGYGHHFPWSVPALFSGLAESDRVPPGPVGFTLVVLVGAGGVVGTILWWRFADQDR